MLTFLCYYCAMVNVELTAQQEQFAPYRIQKALFDHRHRYLSTAQWSGYSGVQQAQVKHYFDPMQCVTWEKEGSHIYYGLSFIAPADGVDGCTGCIALSTCGCVLYDAATGSFTASKERLDPR
jgi:hypothetical protein